MTQSLPPDRLTGLLAFVQAAQALKDTLRSGHTARGRPESTAEHTWSLCLLVLTFAPDLDREVDLLRLLKLCIIHDLGEAISGDVPATHQTAGDAREARERADLATLCAPLPDDVRAEILALWEEYSAAQTPEAHLAKGFDKIETMLQHLSGKNPPGFDYAFNLTYGTTATDRHPLLRQIREAVDRMTRARCS